jgi:hypothetical protein
MGNVYFTSHVLWTRLPNLCDTHHIWPCSANSKLQFHVCVDVLGGNRWLVNRFDPTCDGELLFVIVRVVGQLPTNVRWGSLTPHHISPWCVDRTSHVYVYVDLRGGNRWLRNRCDQHVMGNCNYPSHVLWVIYPPMYDGEL